MGIAQFPKHPSISVRPMLMEDIHAGMQLSLVAGWNQVDADWRFLLGLGSGKNLVAQSEKEVVGTVTSIPYSTDFYWIGMMLVSPSNRRQGIGTRLIKEVMKCVQNEGTFGLDATPLGKKLYDSLGFKETASLMRYQRIPTGIRNNDGEVLSQPIKKADLESIYTYDTNIFGTDRRHILKYIWNRNHDYAWKLITEKGMSGYLLGRPGRIYDHLGPVVSNSLDIADLLISTVLFNNPQTAFVIDAYVENEAWISILKKKGFTPQRSLIRMCCGTSWEFGQNQKIFASAGPELG